MAGLGLAVLRLALAVVFAAHGAHQLFGIWAGPGVGPGGVHETAAQFSALGLHPEQLLAVLAGVTQLAGALLLALGVLTRWAGVALIVYLGIGIWKAHLPWGLFLNWVNTPGRGHGIEYSLLQIAALLCLIFTGAGDWSFDGQRANSRAARAAGRARLRGKV